ARDYVSRLRATPREHALRGRALLLHRDLLEALHDLDVALEVLALEARMRETPVTVGQIGFALDRAGEHAAPQRRVGDERDAELAGRLQRFFAIRAVEQRIFVLYRRDRMNLVRAADRLRARLRQTDGAHLARFHEALHCADRLLDRHLGIDAVLVIHVDHVDAETLQARLASAQDVRRAAIHILLPVGALGLAELGRHHHPIAAAAQCLAE